MTIKRKISKRQAQALRYWNDNITTELLYGGGARGGKTRLFAQICIDMCTRFAGCRGGVGRDSLKDLKATFLLSFFEQAAEDGLKNGVDYEYNDNTSQIKFKNGSMIFLVDLGWYPSDPEYDRLGGYELTFGLVEEGQQVEQKAKNVFKTRICYRLDDFGLIPKLGATCNPGNNWTKQEFYKPWREGKLPTYKAFVPALATDNPFCPKSYIDELRRAPVAERERLLYGNWDYDDDPARMMSYDAITDLFTNIVIPLPSENYLICDVARFGSDMTVIAYFEGLVLQKIKAYKKLSTTQVVGLIEQWRELYKVPKSFTIVDEGGVGGGVVDQGGYKGFMGGRSPYDKKFANLNAECQFKLSEIVNSHKMLIKCESDKIKQMIQEDLEQVRRKDPDKDGKLQVISKDIRKERLGRSPDFGDVLMMRMFFEVVPKPSVSYLS